jgi:fructose-1,6-bisphosphatase I
MGKSGERSNDRNTAAPRRIDTVLNAIADTVPEIRGAFETHRTYEDEENPSGEQVLAADVFVDDLLQERLGELDCVGTYASEERADATDVGTGLSLAVDPLDGSSNLGSNNGVGTIVGLYDAPLPASGQALVGAMYVVYGPVTTAMVASPEGVTEYMLVDGEPEVLTEDVTLPESGTVYGFGGPVPEWSGAFRRYAMSIQRRLKRRYGGALVSDVNQVLSKGGVFAYPALDSRPEGKLRLQFEGHPMAHVVETAGGASTDGTRSLLEKTPAELHERSPVFVGNESLVADLESTL